MDTAESSLVVVVRDHAGAALPVTAISLVAGDDVLALEADDEQRWTVATAGLAWGQRQLRVEFGDRPVLCVRLEVALANDEVALGFVGPRPRCARLERDAANHRTVLSLTLGTAHEELIFVAGWDYSGGADNRRWCETWRDDLYAGQTWISGSACALHKRIHDHTVVTLFDFETGYREQQLPGEGGWHEGDRSLQGQVPTHLGDYHDDAATAKRHADDSISIVHVYEHITALGRQSPGSLVEFHIFSHAWAGGPILVNTNERTRYRHSPRRDPADKDGRLKDFNEANIAELDAFVAAFAPGAIAKIWGCYATTLYRRMVRAAAKADDPDKELTIRADDIVRKMSAREIEDEFRETIIGDSYMARLGRVAGVAVYGAPPGMGANLKRIKKRYYMFVPERVYALEYRWYEDALGLEPDVSGHFAYTKGAAAAD